MPHIILYLVGSLALDIDINFDFPSHIRFDRCLLYT